MPNGKFSVFDVDFSVFSNFDDASASFFASASIFERRASPQRLRTTADERFSNGVSSDVSFASDAASNVFPASGVSSSDVSFAGGNSSDVFPASGVFSNVFPASADSLDVFFAGGASPNVFPASGVSSNIFFAGVNSSDVSFAGGNSSNISFAGGNSSDVFPAGDVSSSDVSFAGGVSSSNISFAGGNSSNVFPASGVSSNVSFAGGVSFPILPNPRVFPSCSRQSFWQASNSERIPLLNAISKRFQRPIFFGDDIFSPLTSTSRLNSASLRLANAAKSDEPNSTVEIAADARGPFCARKKFFRNFLQDFFGFGGVAPPIGRLRRRD